MKIFLFILLAIALAGSQAKAVNKWDIAKLDLTKLPPAADKQGVTYARDIRPIFESSCLRCHREERSKGDLRLDNLESALEGGKDGKVIVPGDSGKSLLVAATAQVNNDVAMPPKHGPGGRGGPGGLGGPPPGGPGDGNPPPGGPGGGRGFGPPPKALTIEQVGLIRAWIDQGAK